MNWITKLPGVSVAAAREHAGETKTFVDTGCYALNAVLSGSIYGGMPGNRTLALAGESSTGKSFFALSIVENFLKSNPTGQVVYYDTESAISTDMMEDRGIDSSRVLMAEVENIEKFKTHCVGLLDAYEAQKDRQPLMIVLDSLGMLPSKKEQEDVASGSEKKDMTKPGIIRGLFRVLILKLTKLEVPMLITNHTYEVVGSYVPMKEMSGGGGLKYAASQIAFLSKKKDRDDTKAVVGNFIKVTMHKSRFSKENSSVTLKLSYSTGLDKYYGLLDLAAKYNIIKRVATRWEFPDGTKVFEKAINKEPEKFYTPEILKLIDEAAAKEFKYGMDDEVEEEVEVD